METLAERIRWAIDQAGIPDREASRRSELNPGQIGLLLARLTKNPDAEVTLPMLLKIARGLGVVDAWLLTGRGDPFDANAWATNERRRRTLAELPSWSERLRLAQERAAERGRNVPEWAWKAAGEITLPREGHGSALMVYELACLCAEHAVGAPRLLTWQYEVEADEGREAPVSPSAPSKATGTNE